MTALPFAGRYDAGGKIVSFVFCNGLRRKQVFQKYQTLEFDPLRLQIFARQTRQKPASLAEQRWQASNDLANSFLWLKHQGGITWEQGGGGPVEGTVMNWDHSGLSFSGRMGWERTMWRGLFVRGGWRILRTSLHGNGFPHWLCLHTVPITKG